MAYFNLIGCTVLIGLVQAYRYCLSPLWGYRCRFYPSCSEYALEALKSLSLGQSCKLIIHRLLRCHPGCKSGFDPLPLIKE